LHRETLDIQGRVLGPEHMETLKTMNNVAWDLVAQGRYDEAEKLNGEVLDIRRRSWVPSIRTPLLPFTA